MNENGGNDMLALLSEAYLKCAKYTEILATEQNL